MAPDREVLSKICAGLGQKQSFFAQESPTARQNPQLRKTQATPHVRLEFTVSSGPLVPFNSTISPRNRPKRRQKAPKSEHCAPTPQKPSTRGILGYVAQYQIPRAASPLATPQPFSGIQASQSPNEPPGHLMEPECIPACARFGSTVGPPGYQGREQINFSKVVPEPLEMLKNVFFARFEPVVAHFGPWKIPKCL